METVSFTCWMEELKKYPASLLNKFNMLRVVTILFIVLFSLHGQSQTVFTLQQCIDSALANNIPVRQSILDMQRAQVDLSQSRSDKLPSLSGSIDHGITQGRGIDLSSNNYVTQSQGYASYGLNSGVTLFNGGRLQNTVKEYAYGYEASRMELQQAKDDLVLDVILAYMLVLNNEDLVQSATNRALVSQSEVDRLTVLNNQGAIPPAQLSDLKGQLMNDQLAILAAKNEVETAKLALLQLMNKTYDSAVEVEKMDVRDYLGAYQKNAQDVYQNALQQFAQIKAVELRKKSFEYQLKATRGELFPLVSIGAGVNSVYTSTARNATGKIPYDSQLRNNIGTSVGVGLAIPIFGRMQTRNRIKVAELDLKNSQLLEQDAKVKLNQQVERAYLNMVNAYNRYHLLEQQVVIYEESFKAADVRFKAGVGTSYDYLQAKDRFDAANINLIRARYEFVFRKKILDYYNGQP